MGMPQVYKSISKPIFDFLTIVGNIINKPGKPINEKEAKKQVGHDLSLSLSLCGEMATNIPL